MGQIVEVTHVEIVSLNGKDTEKITLLLKNEEWVKRFNIVSFLFFNDLLSNFFYLTCSPP